MRGVRFRVSLPDPKAGRRRTMDERFFVRFPAAYRAIADRWTRLPLRSRLRRLILARVIRRGMAAVNRRDFDALLLAFDPGVQYRAGEDWIAIGMDEVTHGHDGYRGVWRQLLDAFEDLHAEPEEAPTWAIRFWSRLTTQGTDRAAACLST